MKLLIIDDNIEITDMIKQYMELEGYEVSVANDGKKGIQLIENQDFTNIILDVAMPEFSGLDVLENLLERNFKDFNKITILTASELDQSINSKIKSFGVKFIVSKPISMSELLKKMQL